MSDTAAFEITSWENVREDFKKVNPKAATIIDCLSPDKRFALIKVRYPFGATVASQGEIYIPNQKGGIQPLSSVPEILKLFKPNFLDRCIPAMMVLKNSAEIFYDMRDRIISAHLARPGTFIGLWEQFDNPSDVMTKWGWNLISGARTIYMLPKITNVQGHKRLRKKYNINTHSPKNYFEQWNTFQEIANNHFFPVKWNTELLLFTDSWVQYLKTDSAWKDLYSFFLHYLWEDSRYCRNRNRFDLLWEKFGHSVLETNIKPNLYLTYLVKQLIITGSGGLPGLTVATDDSTAPISALQKIYVEDYGLKPYTPIFMVPHSFSFKDKDPTYFSIQYPNLFETIPITQNMPSTLSAIPDIRFLLKTFKERSIGDASIVGTSVEYFFNNVQLDYFHNREEKFNGISSTLKLVDKDDRLKPLPAYKKNNQFPDASSIINGCIRFMNNALKESGHE